MDQINKLKPKYWFKNLACHDKEQLHIINKSLQKYGRNYSSRDNIKEGGRGNKWF